MTHCQLFGDHLWVPSQNEEVYGYDTDGIAEVEHWATISCDRCGRVSASWILSTQEIAEIIRLKHRT